MKKVILILIVVICLFCLCGNIFAQDFSTLNENFVVYSNFRVFFQGSQYVLKETHIFRENSTGFGISNPFARKPSFVYLEMEFPIINNQDDEPDKSAFSAALINLVFGFGIGSKLVWNDQIGFVSQLLTEIIGIGVVLAFLVPPFGFSQPWDLTVIVIGASIGGLIVIIGRFYGIFHPYIFKKEQEQKTNNETDTNNNNNDETLSEGVIVLPIFSITPEGEIALGISIEF